MSEPCPLVGFVDKADGYCQCCSNEMNYQKVWRINCHGWITRLCADCMARLVRQVLDRSIDGEPK